MRVKRPMLKIVNEVETSLFAEVGIHINLYQE